jgi:hypothetical protein
VRPVSEQLLKYWLKYAKVAIRVCYRYTFKVYINNLRVFC